MKFIKYFVFWAAILTLNLIWMVQDDADPNGKIMSFIAASVSSILVMQSVKQIYLDFKKTN